MIGHLLRIFVFRFLGGRVALALMALGFVRSILAGRRRVESRRSMRDVTPSEPRY
jgi:hypothetical protein